MFFAFYLVIYVSFLRFNYFISEGGQEEVCLELSGVTGETDADLWVGVVSQDFNAVGKKFSEWVWLHRLGYDRARQTIWKSKNWWCL